MLVNSLFVKGTQANQAKLSFFCDILSLTIENILTFNHSVQKIFYCFFRFIGNNMTTIMYKHFWFVKIVSKFV